PAGQVTCDIAPPCPWIGPVDVVVELKPFDHNPAIPFTDWLPLMRRPVSTTPWPPMPWKAEPTALPTEAVFVEVAASFQVPLKVLLIVEPEELIVYCTVCAPMMKFPAASLRFSDTLKVQTLPSGRPVIVGIATVTLGAPCE